MKARLMEVYQADEVGKKKERSEREREREICCTNGLRQQDWKK